MDDRIHINDESGDRRHFRIIPNYILNHSTIYDREAYIQLKRVAGENGIAFMSMSNLAKKVGCRKSTLRKSIKYLIERRWIANNGKIAIMTGGGMQFVDSYRVADIWKLNADFYEEQKGGSNGSPPTSKGGQTGAPGGVKRGRKEEHVIKEERPNSFFKDDERRKEDARIRRMCQ